MPVAPAKPAVVGGFVLGALLLGVVATLVFGGTRWFSHREQVMAVFTDSLSGLGAGSPVTFRGVTIGRVEAIRVRVNAPTIAPVIQVYLALEPDKISWTNGKPSDPREDLQTAVTEGLRAQLRSQSLITGELSVDLDFHPNAAAVAIESSDGTLQIPTIASDLQQFKDQVRDMKLPEIADQTRQVLQSVQRLVNTIEPVIGPLSASLQTTLTTSTTAVREIQSQSTLALEQFTTDGKELDVLLKAAEQATAHTDQLVTSLDAMTSTRSPLRTDLDGTLRDLAASSSSLRLFTHDLERNPLGTLMKKPSP
jgi:paraquat-inducible protein B